MNTDYEISKVKELLEDPTLRGPEKRALKLYLESLIGKRIKIKFTNKMDYETWRKNVNI